LNADKTARYTSEGLAAHLIKVLVWQRVRESKMLS
jgi:hypothetical protein